MTSASPARPFLVMGLLEGESLADRIARGPVPLEQVLTMGIEIAAALDAAHRSGVIHRDVKPGNIILTRTGAKLLDFGLAKPPLGDESAEASMRTAHKPITEQGTILGTFQYMSPEQVEGRPADARSDLFSLGAVLYEATTGQRPFDGKSKASLIAAILDHDPPSMSVTRPMTPPLFDRVIRALLRKDPDQRTQTAHDLLLQLTWIRDGTSPGEAIPAGAIPRRRARAFPWVMAGFLALTTLIFAALWLRRSSAAEPVTVLSILSASGSANELSVSLSPDGRSIAFISGLPGEIPSLWVRRFGETEPVRIAGTEGSNWPFWSPDGTSIGFFSVGKLKRVNVATGSIQQICDSRYGVGAAWHRDGTIIFGSAFNEGLQRVSAAGGEPAPFTRLDASRHESLHAWPHFLPDGKRLVHLVRTRADSRNEIVIRAVDGGPATLLVRADALGGVAGDHLMYVRENVLYAHPLDQEGMTLRGEPVEIARNVAYAENWARSGLSVAGNVIAYAPILRVRAQVQELDRRGVILRTLFRDDWITEAELSPDGRLLLYSKTDPKKGAADIWIRDLPRSTSRRLTSGLANNYLARWAPDGKSFAFLSDRSGMYDLYGMDASGGALRTIWQSGRDKQDPSFARDGRIIVMVDTPEYGGDLYWADDPARPVVSSPLHENDPVVSPDGNWIAYATFSSSADSNQIWVVPRRGGTPIQISDGGGAHPAWSPDGSEIFYAAPDQRWMAVPFRNGDPGTPQELFQLPRTTFDHPVRVTSTGTFLITAYDLSQTAVHRFEVIMQWREMLRKE